MSSLFFQLLILTSIFALSTEQEFIEKIKQEVHIISGVPNTPEKLRFRCQSKDTDFGIHQLDRDQEFYWRFGLNPFGRTLYFCHFYWGSLEAVFNVFDGKVKLYCEQPTNVVQYKCYWVAKPDGFYLSNNNSTTGRKFRVWGPNP